MLIREAMNMAAKMNMKATPKLKLCGYTQYTEMRNPRIEVTMKLPFSGAACHLSLAGILADFFLLTISKSPLLGAGSCDGF